MVWLESPAIPFIRLGNALSSHQAYNTLFTIFPIQLL